MESCLKTLAALATAAAATFDVQERPEENENVPDFVTEFPAVTSIEQRARCKREFDANYGRYRELLQHVKDVSKKFVRMQRSLRQFSYGTESHRLVAQAIKLEYRQMTYDDDFIEIREEMYYLEAKLEHLRNIVADFDRRMGRL